MEYVLDIETTFDHSRIRMAGVLNAGIDLSVFYDFESFGALNLHTFLLSLDEEDVVYTWNGARFDLPLLHRHKMDITNYKFKHVDLMLFCKMLMPDLQSHSLKNVALHFFPHDDDLKKLEPWVEAGVLNSVWYDTCSKSELMKYCGQDLRVTMAVAQRLKFYAKDSGGKWSHAVQIEGKIAEITDRQVQRGVLFSTEEATRLHAHICGKMISIEDRLKHELPVIAVKNPHAPPKSQFLKNGSPSKRIIDYCEKYGYTVEPAWDRTEVTERRYWAKKDAERYILPITESLQSNVRLTLGQQAEIKGWLIDKGWKPSQWNSVKLPDGKYKVTTPRLSDRMTKEPCPNLSLIGVEWVPLLVEWLMLRSRKNLLKSDNGTGWIPYAEANDNIIPSDADTVGANTGRYIHKRIVNIPRVSSPLGENIRKLFRARSDKVWVGWDASSLEACMEAHYVHQYDPVYARSLYAGSSEEGTDVHTLNMKAMRLPSRDIAKTFKYAITYGAGPSKIADTLGCTLSKAKEYYELFWETNSGLRQFKEELYKEWSSFDRKYIVGLDGRLIKTRSEHSLVNAKFQSSGAIVMKHACIIADKRISTAYPDAYGLIRYHDEEIWECNPVDAPSILAIGCNSVTDAGRFLKLNIPLAATGKIGGNWADVH